MSSNSITVQVPVKRHVKKFLEFRYGTPALIDRSDTIGKCFFNFVEEPTQEKDKRINLKNFEELLTIELTQSVFFQKGYILTPTNVVAFNRVVEDEIDLALEYFVSGAVVMAKLKKIKVKRTEAYDQFLSRIGLTYADLPYDTLQKKIARAGFFKNAA